MRLTKSFRLFCLVDLLLCVVWLYSLYSNGHRDDTTILLMWGFIASHMIMANYPHKFE